MHKRINAFTLIVSVLFALIIIRLYFLQINKNDVFGNLAVSQRQVDTITIKERGEIYDKNMIPFTNREDSYFAVVKASEIENISNLSEILSKYSTIDYEKIDRKIRTNNIAQIELKTRPDIKIKGVSIIGVPKRYDEKSIARHILGYVNENENIGVTGIEKQFNNILSKNSVKKIGMIGDARKNILNGFGFKFSEYQGKNESVRLTLDYKIQKIAEKAMENVKKGAVVVTDVYNGDILAVVSTPTYDQNNLTSYIKSSDGELTNRAFMSYNAGSVFKIIVAAAALENKVASPLDLYYCSGKIDVFGKIMACHKSEGHGWQSFTDAFANSCNPAFIEIGLKLGQQPILDMAKRFGLSKTVGLYDTSGEMSGNIPERMVFYPADTANISIGQGDIMVTPLQVADIVTTIANEGIRKKLNIIDSLVDNKGNVLNKIKISDEKRVVSSPIARQISYMMKKVTEVGTGKIASIEGVEVAGKTGSAETGWSKNGKNMVHGWFTGFFPYNNPHYTITVFTEDGRSGAISAAPVFKQIAEEILKLN